MSHIAANDEVGCRRFGVMTHSKRASRESGSKSKWTTAPLESEITVGSPVRFLRRARYSLYYASDGRWYLGYRRCNADGASACGAIQPVSGPYRAYSADPHASGLLFEYFDATGHRLAPASSQLALARVDITARSESAHQIPFGIRSNKISDSAKVSLAIRNVAR